MQSRAREPTGGRFGEPRRAQSELLGLVFLLGIVAVASVALLSVGSGMITDTEQEAEHEAVEQSFVELSHTISSMNDEDVTRHLEFDAGEHGAIARDETGEITVETDEVHWNESIGTIEYRSTDGTTIAYEAGGVFRETGDATQVVSTPNIHYDADDETLTMPITTVVGEKHLDSGGVSIERLEMDRLHDAAVIQDEEATITVQSEYYQGWAEYFEHQAGDTVVREVDHETNTVVALFGYEDAEGAFEDDIAVHHDGGVKKGGGFDGFESEGRHAYPPLDDPIERMIADANSGELDVDRVLTGDDDVDGGTFFIDEISHGDQLQFDVSDGNATLVVEGDVRMDDTTEIRVTDWSDDTALRIYAGGERMDLGGEICGGTGDCDRKAGAKHIQLYGTSAMSIDMGPGGNQGGTTEAVIYVAADEQKDWWNGGADLNGYCDDGADSAQVVMQAGNEDFYGSIVAYSVCGQSSAVSFDHDPDLEHENVDIYPDEYPLPPQLTYLNIVHHEVDIDAI